jgi:patatin-like phospholipase/acyl hydrolase
MNASISGNEEYLIDNSFCTKHTAGILLDAIKNNNRSDIAIGLAIDGGGVKGLTSILLLKHIFSNKHIPDYFDLMAGTSTGGIIIAALSAQTNGSYIFSTSEVLKMYMEPKKLFRRNLFSINGFFSSKYKSNESFFKEILGDIQIQNTKTNVLIMAYNYTWDKMKYFKNNKPGYYLHQVLTATSAAPTYFPPLILKNNERNDQEEELRDGGVGMNDPSFYALTEMNLLRKSKEIDKGKKYNLLIRIDTVSIGHLPRKRGPNSILGTIPHLTKMFMGVAESIVDENVITLMDDNRTLVFNLNIPLIEASMEMDNCSEKNIKNLIKDTQKYINKHKLAINILKMFLEI